MVCKKQFVGDKRDGWGFPNWSGDVWFSPSTLWEPKHTAGGVIDGLMHLVEVMFKAKEEGKSVHAIGSGWAFEDLAASDDWMVSLRYLDRQLDYLVGERSPALTLDWKLAQANPMSETVLVHFEAGIEIAKLSKDLDDDGLALPTLGGENGQALAGVISTSTHGGDWKQPPFPDLVRAIHLVIDGGEELWIERFTDRITTDVGLALALPCATLVSDDRVFNAALVACGRFGVVYSYVLEVRRKFRVVEVVTTPARTLVLGALREGVDNGTLFQPLFDLLSTTPSPLVPTPPTSGTPATPSPFSPAPPTSGTPTTNPPTVPTPPVSAPGLPDAIDEPYFLQIVFNSQKPDDVWVNRRWITENPADLPPGGAEPGHTFAEEQAMAVGIVEAVNLALASAGATLPIATLLAAPLPVAAPLLPLIPVLGSLAVSLSAVAAAFNNLIRSRPLTLGSVMAAALETVWNVPQVSHVIPDVNHMVINSRFDDAMAHGRRGQHHVITKDPIPDSIKSASFEVVFDATTADYLDFLELILPVAPLFQQVGYISLRPSRRSNAYLSMHGVPGSHAISIEIASLLNLPGNAAWMGFVHRLAVSRNGRPHWGQYNKLDALDVAMLYGSALNEWREGLLKVSGTSTRFSNEFSRARGLEPVAIAREVRAVHRTADGVITYLCNEGERWSPVKVAQAIDDIKSGAIEYFVRTRDRIVPVSEVDGKYVRSKADDSQVNNLDNLPPC